MSDHISTKQEISVHDQVFKKRIVNRYYRAVDYLSIYAYVMVVYGGALFADYLLFELMWLLLAEEVQKYELVKLAFDYARIGLALLFLLCALVHGMLSTYSQLKLDLELVKEDKQTK